MAQTDQVLQGGIENGSGVDLVGIAGGVSVTLWPPPSKISGGLLCTDREPMRLTLNASGETAFRLTYLYSPDGGTTWVVGQQITAVVTATDPGITGNFAYAARIDISVGYLFKVILSSPTSSALAQYCWDWRYYSAS